MNLIQSLAILDQVSNNEGVTYQVFLGVIGVMLTIFVAVLVGLMNIINVRAIRHEDKQDKALELINELKQQNSDIKNLLVAANNSNILNFAAIKEKLNIQNLPSDLINDNPSTTDK
jgi:predicted phage-related endonuclease